MSGFSRTDNVVTNMAASRLQRFKDAQDQSISGFESALSEIRAGGKRSHWIWYVFPQLAGLGQSSVSRMYGLEDVAEAREYLIDPLLRSRLLTIANAVAEQLDLKTGGSQDPPRHATGETRRRAGGSLERVMGSSIDAAKLVSSMTLFGAVAARLHVEEGLDEFATLARAAERILRAAAAEDYRPCQFTLDRLSRQ